MKNGLPQQGGVMLSAFAAQPSDPGPQGGGSNVELHPFIDHNMPV